MNNSCNTRHTLPHPATPITPTKPTKPAAPINPANPSYSSFRLYIILQYLLSAYI